MCKVWCTEIFLHNMSRASSCRQHRLGLLYLSWLPWLQPKLRLCLSLQMRVRTVTMAETEHSTLGSLKISFPWLEWQGTIPSFSRETFKTQPFRSTRLQQTLYTCIITCAWKTCPMCALLPKSRGPNRAFCQIVCCNIPITFEHASFAVHGVLHCYQMCEFIKCS